MDKLLAKLPSTLTIKKTRKEPYDKYTNLKEIRPNGKLNNKIIIFFYT